MAKKNIVIVGNKLLENLNLCKAIDSFDKIFRCNLASVGLNNGVNFGSLAMCQHVYDRFVANPRDKSEIMDLYAPEYEDDYLSEWFDKKVNVVRQAAQNKLLAIYNRVFNLRRERTSCGSCIKTMIDELKVLFNQYN